MLAITGPVDVPGIDRRIAADEVVAFVTNEAYGEFDEDGSRKPVLGDVAEAVLTEFLSGGVDDPAEAVTVLGQAAAAGRLMLHAVDPAAQAAFVTAGVDGGFPAGRGTDLLGVVVNNAGANKLDFYLDRTVAYRVRLDGSGGAVATAAVELASDAPRTGRSRTVLGPNYGDLRAGENLSLLAVYCGRDCRLGGVRRDGEAAGTATGTEFGHPVFDTMVRLPPGGRHEVAYDWSLPQAWEAHGDLGRYRLVVPNQPGIRDLRLRVEVEVPAGARIVQASEGFTVEEGHARFDALVSARAQLEVLFTR
jgi:hypothetical protein